MSNRKKPKYDLHKATGQARVRIEGKSHYLGKYGTPQSYERYEELIREWLLKGGDGAQKFTMTVDDLCLLFLEHAKQHYRKAGKITSEVSAIQTALRPLIAKFGPIRAREFSPKMLKQVRQAMIEAKFVRSSINDHISRIRRVFKWGVSEEYVPPETLTALEAVTGLQKGRTNATEGQPVRPVPSDHIQAIQPHVTSPIWGMIQAQLLTGMRPGEVTVMRGRDLDRSGTVWEYVPESHKTEHHGKQRIILIGPRAQKVLAPFLQADPEAYLFSPMSGLAEHHEERRQKAGKVQDRPRVLSISLAKRRQPGDYYPVCSYRNAIKRACRKADVPEWHPNRLRHNAATELRKAFDLESVRIILGHSNMRTSEIYAERDLDSARAIAQAVG